MSRVQGKDASVFSDIANTTIANELESRLKELERNIAVARQFIKLADECYTQVRHEWDLLQRDIHTSRPETDLSRFSTTPEKKNIEHSPFEESAQAKDKSKPQADEDKSGFSAKPSKTETNLQRGRVTLPARKETEPPHESDDPNSRSRAIQGHDQGRKGKRLSPEHRQH